MPAVDYKDVLIRLRGRFGCVPLFRLTDAQAVHEKLVTPALELFRGGH